MLVRVCFTNILPERCNFDEFARFTFILYSYGSFQFTFIAKLLNYIISNIAYCRCGIFLNEKNNL